jgi:hypothetical protein
MMKRILSPLLIVLCIVFLPACASGGVPAGGEPDVTAAPTTSSQLDQTAGTRVDPEFATVYMEIPFGEDGDPTTYDSGILAGTYKPDIFYTADDYIFIRDVYREEDQKYNQILVFKNGNYDQIIHCDDHDLDLIFYNSQKGILQVAYHGASGLCVGKYDITEGTKVNESEEPSVVSQYCFDEFGDIVTGDLLSEDKNTILSYGVIGEPSNEVIFVSQDRNEKVMMYKFHYHDKEGGNPYIVIKNNGEYVQYAKMMPDSMEFNRGMISVTKIGNTYDIYQMVVRQSGVIIYKLNLQPMATFSAEQKKDVSLLPTPRSIVATPSPAPTAPGTTPRALDPSVEGLLDRIHEDTQIDIETIMERIVLPDVAAVYGDWNETINLYVSEDMARILGYVKPVNEHEIDLDDVRWVDSDSAPNGFEILNDSTRYTRYLLSDDAMAFVFFYGSSIYYTLPIDMLPDQIDLTGNRLYAAYLEGSEIKILVECYLP